MEFNIVSRRTEIAYKAEEADEVAQHAKVQGCASMVNAAVVQSEFAFLSGETCHTCASETKSGGVSNDVDDEAGVSRRPWNEGLNVRSGEAPVVDWNLR